MTQSHALGILLVIAIVYQIIILIFIVEVKHIMIAIRLPVVVHQRLRYISWVLYSRLQGVCVNRRVRHVVQVNYVTVWL